jgi:hypothetical protein
MRVIVGLSTVIPLQEYISEGVPTKHGHEIFAMDNSRSIKMLNWKLFSATKRKNKSPIVGYNFGF